ncbi:MAG: metallophosphoesterase [Thermoguttaceae bacterium]|nr:metallophosphoesterase [Thermoguttaceae bacterium]
MKRVKLIVWSALLFSVAGMAFGAQPQAELLRETLPKPIAGDLSALPTDGKTGDYFNARSAEANSITFQYGIQKPSETGIHIDLFREGEKISSFDGGGRFGRVIFSGLEPETEYTAVASLDANFTDESYTLNGLTGQEAFKSLTVPCRTMAVPKGELLVRAAFVSDTHVSIITEVMKRLHCSSTRILADLCRDAEARGCQVMIHGGDVTNATEEKEFEMAKESFAEFSGPVYAVAGNHDATGPQGKELILWRKELGRAAVYEVFGGVQFLGLNTADGSLNKEENFAAAAKLDPEKPAVIFSHFQLVKDDTLNDKNKAISDADECAAILDKIAASKSVIYVGHKNVATTAYLGNVPQINMPQTTQFPMGWLEAEIRTDGIYQTFVFSSNAELEELSRVLGGNYLGTIGYRDWRSFGIWNRFVPWPNAE